MFDDAVVTFSSYFIEPNMTTVSNKVMVQVESLSLVSAKIKMPIDYSVTDFTLNTTVL